MMFFIKNSTSKIVLEKKINKMRFVTQKIISTAVRIANGSKERLQLGNLDICRDWGWAPEYVEAMWLMLQQKAADDFVIATGESYSLEEFVEKAFSCFGLDWRTHVLIDPELMRPADITIGQGNPAKANAGLEWNAINKMPDVVRLMVKAQLEDSGEGITKSFPSK